MYMRALEGYEEADGKDQVETYLPALNTMCNMANIFADLLEKQKAAEMYSQALTGFIIMHGSDSRICKSLSNEIEAFDETRDDSAVQKPDGITKHSKSRVLSTFIKKLIK
jgi:hypothetical protein